MDGEYGMKNPNAASGKLAGATSASRFFVAGLPTVGSGFVIRLSCSVLLPVLLVCGCAAPEPPRVEDYLPRTEVMHAAEPGRGAAPGPSEPLTLDACVRIALDNNPVQRAAREGVAAARHAIGEARSAYFPKLTGIIGYSRVEAHNFFQSTTPQGGTLSFDIPARDSYFLTGIFTWTLYDFGSRYSQLKAAMARKGIAESDLARARLDIALNVYQAFYALQVAQEAQTIARKTVDRAKDNLQLARDRRDVGAAPEIDVLRADVDLAQARLDLVRANSLVRTARGNLNTAMGLPVEMSIDVVPPPDHIVSPDEIDLQKALDQAVHRRPEVMSALHNVDAARRSVSGAKSAFGPSISLTGVYVQQGTELFPKGQAWFYGVFASYPVFEGLVKLRRLSRTKSEQSQAEAQAAGTVLEVRSEVWLAQSRLTEAYEGIAAAAVLVQRAEESYRTTRERYRNGAATVNELLDAQTALARAEASAAQARWQYRTASAEFRRAVGTLLAEEER